MRRYIPLFLFLFSLSLVSAVTVCSDNFDPSSGNWVISSSVTCDYESFNLQGNLTVKKGGNLTLRGTTISVESRHAPDYVVVEHLSDGLTLDNSTLQAYRESNRYKLIVSSLFRAVDSVLLNIDGGFVVNASDAVLSNSTVADSEFGLVLSGDSVSAANVTFSSLDSDAVRVKDSTGSLFEACSISGAGGYDVHVLSGSSSDVVSLRGSLFNTTNVKVASSTSRVDYQWFTNVYVNDSGPVSGASVNATDVHGNLVFEGTTGSDGWLYGNYVTERKVLIGSDDVLTPHEFRAEYQGSTSCFADDIVSDDQIILTLGSSGCGDIG